MASDEFPEFEISSLYEADISVLHQCDWHDASVAALAVEDPGEGEPASVAVETAHRQNRQSPGPARADGETLDDRHGTSLGLLASALGGVILGGGSDSDEKDGRHGQSFSSVAADTSEDDAPELPAPALGEALLLTSGKRSSSRSNQPPDKPIDIHIRGCRRCALLGTYALAGEDSNGACFFRSCGEPEDFLYARDGRWLFGPGRDSDGCWAFADSSDALPPRHGWVVPACQHGSKMWLDPAKQATRSTRFALCEPVAHRSSQTCVG